MVLIKGHIISGNMSFLLKGRLKWDQGMRPCPLGSMAYARPE